jgi:hypothetical protein
MILEINKSVILEEAVHKGTKFEKKNKWTNKFWRGVAAKNKKQLRNFRDGFRKVEKGEKVDNLPNVKNPRAEANVADNLARNDHNPKKMKKQDYKDFEKSPRMVKSTDFQ